MEERSLREGATEGENVGGTSEFHGSEDVGILNPRETPIERRSMIYDPWWAMGTKPIIR